MTKHKDYISGHGEKDPDAALWLKPTCTDPYKHSASDVGYNARWDDDGGTSGKRDSLGTDGWDDNSSFTPEAPSWQGDHDAPHQRLSALIDGQVDQPAGPLVGGGGPVSDNKHGGVGDGPPRYRSKAGNKVQNRDSRGGVDRSGHRSGRR